MSQQRSRFWRIFLSNCTEFSKNSTVHGLNYLINRQATKREKAFWLATIAIAISLGVYLIYKSYVRYEEKPVVVSINKNFFTWKIPFPSTTWCLANKVDEEKAKNFIGRFKPNRQWGVTEGEQLEYFMDFLKVLTGGSYQKLGNFSRFVGDSRFKRLDLQSAMSEVNYNAAKYDFVTYTGKKLHCQEMLTEQGICFSTAVIAPYLSPKSSARFRAENDSEPDPCTFYSLPCFARVLNISRPLEFYVHSPFDLPDSRSKFWRVREDLGIDVFFSFLNTEAHSSLEALRMEQRRCNLPEETFPFSESPFYSFRLCQMNCRRTLCMELCKCVPHFYIKRADQPICNLEGLLCLSKFANYIISLGSETEKHPCTCYPSCSTTEYISEKEINIPARQIYFSGMRYSWTIDIYPRIAVSRHVIFGFDGLLVNLGGIAGFLVGSSIISVIEAVYFFTIRLLRRFLTEKADSGNPEIQQNLRKEKKVTFNIPINDNAFPSIPFRL